MNESMGTYASSDYGWWEWNTFAPVHVDYSQAVDSHQRHADYRDYRQTIVLLWFHPHFDLVGLSG
jgi:hypothetical protein